MKKTYLVAEGFERVNGQPVPPDRKVHLSDAEAFFDLGLGRISLAKPRRKKPVEPAPEA